MSSRTSTTRRVPLKARPWDFIYASFLAVHIPATLLIDCQAVYPSTYKPWFLEALMQWYHAAFRDPLIGGISGRFNSKHGLGGGGGEGLEWFKTFVYLELIFQLPIFIIGFLGLYHNNKKVYPVLLAYAASSATTTLACLVSLWTTPESTPARLAQDVPCVSAVQRAVLVGSYASFFVVPLVMALDLAGRLVRMCGEADGEKEKTKTK